jgi:hypothetical protein
VLNPWSAPLRKLKSIMSKNSALKLTQNLCSDLIFIPALRIITKRNKKVMKSTALSKLELKLGLKKSNKRIKTERYFEIAILLSL